MKKVLLIAVLSCLSFGACARWINIGRNDAGADIFYDPATVQKLKNGNVQVVYLNNIPSQRFYPSIKQLLELDCDGHFVIRDAQKYSLPMAEGNVEWQQDPKRAQPVYATQMGNAAYLVEQAACKR